MGGFAAFTITVGGLMFETCFSGQKYKYYNNEKEEEEEEVEPLTDHDNNDNNEDYVFAKKENSTTAVIGDKNERTKGALADETNEISTPGDKPNSPLLASQVE